MKRLTLTLFLVAGCTAIDAEQPRRYQCTTQTDCRAGWVCTLDEFCADPAVGEDMSCEEQTDCTGGWLCALTSRCVNPREGKPLPCFEAIDCPGQWKCTQLGQCADPDAGVAWPCTTTDDCTGGWHCGPAGVCYDLLEAEDVRCRPDAGDCGPDWRCGLEGVCHLRGQGAPLRCLSDSDCEGGWSCDSLGVCADARAGFPLAPADGGVPVVTPVAPLVGDTVDHLAVGDEFNAGDDFGLRAVAFTKGTRLHVLLVTNRGTFGLDAGPPLPDGGFLGDVTTRSFLHSVVVNGTTRSLSVLGGSVVRADQNGVIERYQVDRDGLRLLGSFDAGFPVDSLRQGNDRVTFTVLGFNQNQYAWWSDAGVGAAALPDLLDVYPYPNSGLRRFSLQMGFPIEERLFDGLFVFSTQSGLLASSLEAPGVRTPITYPTRMPSAVRLGEEHFVADSGVAFSFGAFESSSEPFFDGGVYLRGPRGLQGFVARDTIPLACSEPPGFFTSYALSDGGTGAFTRCAAPSQDGGTEDALIAYEEGLGGPLLGYARGAPGWRFSENNQGPFGLSYGGQLAISDDDRHLVRSLFPAEASPRLHNTPDNPLHLMPGRQVSPETCDDIEGFECTEWFRPTVCNRDASGQSICSRFQFPLSPVRNRPKWVVLDLRGDDVPPGAAPFFFASLRMGGLELDGFLGGAPDLGSIGVATAETRSDAGTLVLVGATDRLYWGDFSVLPQFSYSLLGSADSIRFATTPLPGGTITDVAPLKVDPASAEAKFAEGLLISSGRPFRYFANNAVVWRTSELVFSGDEAVSVHPLGRLARIVFRDGSVFSYPSRVQIAPPIAASSSVVIATASACDQLFALTAGGLYWLQGGADAAGRWALVPTTTANFAGGALLGDPDRGDLYLYLPDGKSQRISVGCGG